MKSVQLPLIISFIFLCDSTMSHASEALLDAAFSGDIAQVEKTLPDTSVNYVDEKGFSALSKASIRGHYEIAKLLLDKGADVKSRTATGITPLMFASSWGHKDIVVLLLEHDAQLEAQDKNGLTAFSLAAKYGRPDLIMVLAEEGANTKILDKQGNTALLWAAGGGHLLVVKRLLSLGADVEQKNNLDQTAIMWAARFGKSSVVKRLIEHGANINQQAVDGATALMSASYYGHPEVVRVLLENGVDKDLKSLDGRTARMIAETQGHKDVLVEMKFDDIVVRRDGEVMTDQAAKAHGYESQGQRQASKPAAGDIVFSGNILSFISGNQPAAVISADAAIFRRPPLTKGAGFFRTAPGGLTQIFTGTLLAFEQDIAEVLVRNAIRDTDVTIRCRVSLDTRGINYRFESIEERAKELKRSYLSKDELDDLNKISADTVRGWIGRPVSVGASGEICGHFELAK